MKSSETIPSTESKSKNTDLKTRSIENHKKTAVHLKEAAMHHEEAAKHHENGNFEKASASTIMAQGHVCCATDLHRADVKYHSTQK